jgi:2-oxoisovalerate dehydrogenase E1 component
MEYSDRDILNIIKLKDPVFYNNIEERCIKLVADSVEKIRSDPEMRIENYTTVHKGYNEKSWLKVESLNKRQVKLLNNFFNEVMSKDPRVIFIGEDVNSPYGGAFKVADGLSSKYSDKVFTTPISEAAIVGLSNGLAISGFKPYVEIMFGDFVPLAMDQIINNSSKFNHMYNKQVNCPIVLRTPMGGKRGYGPTHSQTLDKFLIGIDNVKTIALNSILNPSEIYFSVNEELNPVIVIENKLDYGRLVGLKLPSFYEAYKTDESYPVVKLSPVSFNPELTIVTYGGMVQSCIDSIELIFSEFEILPEILVLSKINPLDLSEIEFSLRNTKKILTVEEGSSVGGVGGEIIASLNESLDFSFRSRRVSAIPVPIPSVKSLEDIVLPSSSTIIKELGVMLK